MKKDILKKATQLFLTLGFKSVTMDDIASELGISKKTIYQHFTTKSDLVEEATLFVFDAISDGIDHICNLNKSAIEELLAIKEFAMTQLNDETSSPFHQLQKYFPKTALRLRKLQFEKVQDCIHRNLEKGIASGLYRSEIDVAFTTRLYFIGVTGIKDREIFPEKLFSSRTVSEKYLAYHMRAIVSEKGLNVFLNLTKNKQLT